MSTEATTQQAPLCHDLKKAQPGQLVVQRWGSHRRPNIKIVPITKVWKSGVIEVEGAGGKTLFAKDGHLRGDDGFTTMCIYPFQKDQTPESVLALHAEGEAKLKAEQDERLAQRAAFLSEVRSANEGYMAKLKLITHTPQPLYIIKAKNRHGDEIAYTFVIHYSDEQDMPWKRAVRVAGLLITKDGTSQTSGEEATVEAALLNVIASEW